MSSVSKDAGTGLSATISGISGTAWTNVDKITVSDNSYATVTLTHSSPNAQPLGARNFGFNIPVTGTIDGVLCSFERKASVNSIIKENLCYLINNLAIIGNNKTSSPAFWSATEGVVTYGGPADTWGATLTPTIVNSSNFGVMITAKYDSPYVGSEIAYVDKVSMTIYYTVDFLCEYGTTDINKIYYGSQSITKVYYGSTRVV